MAAIVWAGTTSTNWFTASNWVGGIAPTSSDDVTISAGTPFQPTIPLNQTATVKSLTMNGDTLTLGDNSSASNSQGLTATNGFTLNGGSIVGQGSLTGNINVTGVAAVTIGLQVLNAQNTPQFEIFGTITDALGMLTLSVGTDTNANLNPGELILTKNSAAHAVAFAVPAGTDKAGQLVLQDTGVGLTLTVGSQMAIGAGSVFLAGASPGAVVLTDTFGATISTGTITGIGKFDSALAASGAAAILTAFGTLEMGGAIADSGGTLFMSLANAADQLILDDVSAAKSVTFAAGTVLELNTAAALTVADQMVLGSNTVKLDGPVSTLTDANGLSLTTGTIIGTGIVNAPINASDAAQITAKGGVLQVNGTVVEPGNKLVMTINNTSDTLEIGGTAAAKTVSYNGGAGTLELGAAGVLTVTDVLAIGGATVRLDGGAASLTDINVNTLSTGTIIGAGFVDGNFMTTGAAHITASGGTLEFTHLDGGSAAILTITGNSDTLKLDFDGTAKTVNFNGGTLKLHNLGGTNFTVTDQLQVGNGTIVMDTAQSALTDTAGITLSFGNIIGIGTITGALSGTGNVAASGGKLELVTPIGASSHTTFQINSGASDILQVDGTVGTGNTFAFIGAGGELGLMNDASFNNTVVGMNAAASIATTNFVDIEGHHVTVTNVTGQGSNTGTITLSDGAVLHLSNISATNWNAYVQNDTATTGTDVFLSTVPCFCRGTLILTEEGEVAVEDLNVGDRVRTLSGGLKPIVWIGMGRDLVTRRNSLARPIIVRCGALADNVPARDLYLTHGHGLYLDGVLIPVENLINHRSILWDESARVVEYYHVELADHDVLLANGAPAESYYDASNRAQFHNTRPGSAAGEAKPTFAPVLNGGASVERAWAKLYERVGGQLAADATADPDAHLVVDGRRLEPTIEEGVYSFAIASPPAGALSLRSRSGVPSLLGITAHDHRRLGIAIRRIVISQAGVATAIEHDAPLFVAGGCHPAEPGYCWTDGELTLPAHLFAHLAGAFTLAVHTEHPGMRYPREGGRSREAA